MFISHLQSFLNHFTNHNFRTLNLITINSKKILHNYDLIAKLNPHTQIWPVLKSNAYGHGYTNIAKILRRRKFEYLIVDSYYEALEIAKVSHQKILLIGSTHPSNFQYFNFKNIAITIQDLPSLQALIRLNKQVKIHLKINTGMNRQGIEVAEIPEYIKLIKKNPHIILDGVFSHLADADNRDNSYTDKQLILFKKALNLFEENNLNPKFTHLSATAESVKIKNPDINALRLGIGLYGYNPLQSKDKYFNKLKSLKPALTLTSTIIKIRNLKAGQKVSYNLTHTLKKDSYVGILPIGYYDGLDRRLSNSGFVKYQNKFYPIIGRVCMNLVIINFGKVKPKLFDQVKIISSNPKDKNSILNISKACSTIPYVILIHINHSIRRIIK